MIFQSVFRLRDYLMKRRRTCLCVCFPKINYETDNIQRENEIILFPRLLFNYYMEPLCRRNRGRELFFISLD